LDSIPAGKGKMPTFRQNDHFFSMTTEQIEKFLLPLPAAKQVRINFKSRNPIIGMFVTMRDYNDLKEKNFWRVVTEKNIETWKKTKDINLVKIFSGSDFTKLALAG
jgi:hypothetical protein